MDAWLVLGNFTDRKTALIETFFTGLISLKLHRKHLAIEGLLTWK